MAWSKIKNIMILILLGTNLCLAGFTLRREVRERQLQTQARADIIAFLQEQGIRVDEELIPDAVTLQPQRVSRDIEKECVLAAALLEGEVTAQARGGEVYRYFNGNGSVQFHSNGDFSAQFAAGVMAVGEEKMEEHGKRILQRLNFQSGTADQGQEEGAQTLTVQQQWQGVPLLACQATLRYEDGCLTAITGRRLTGEPELEEGGTPVTVATALMRFYTGMNALGDVCSQISGITQAYTVASTVFEPAPLTPVWCIATDTGNYQLDTLTGALTRTM